MIGSPKFASGCVLNPVKLAVEVNVIMGGNVVITIVAGWVPVPATVVVPAVKPTVVLVTVLGMVVTITVGSTPRLCGTVVVVPSAWPGTLVVTGT